MGEKYRQYKEIKFSTDKNEADFESRLFLA